MKWFLKSSFDQNSIMINHKPNSDFKSRIIIGGTQEGLLELLVSMFQQNAKKMNSRKCQLH
jgi:hypothetical protein